jgi:hypothetical protein
MKPLKRILIVAILGFAVHQVVAQPQPQMQMPQRADWANMDSQQLQQMIQQRVLEALREPLAVTNDTEWRVIESRLSKVTQLRMETMLGSGLGMLGGMRRGGNSGGGFAGLAGLADPQMENLQKLINDRAPTAQIKEALAKLREARKQKEAELVQAQGDLRAVLSLRQEAILVQYGVLD